MHRTKSNETVFHAIADTSRRALLDRLRSQPIKAGELAAGFSMSRPAVSKHLRILREAGLVEIEKSGREIVYRLRPEPLLAVQDWLLDYREFWQSSLSQLKKNLEG